MQVLFFISFEFFISVSQACVLAETRYNESIPESEDMPMKRLMLRNIARLVSCDDQDTVYETLISTPRTA